VTVYSILRFMAGEESQTTTPYCYKRWASKEPGEIRTFWILAIFSQKIRYEWTEIGRELMIWRQTAPSESTVCSRWAKNPRPDKLRRCGLLVPRK